jgi:hypothetical protein
MQSNTVPQFWGGNNPAAVQAYIATLDAIRCSLSPHLGWHLIADSKAIPSRVARRIQSLNAEIEQIAPDKAVLENQLRQIQAAHAAAESLPIDLEALTQANKKVTQLEKEATTAAGLASASAGQSTIFLKEIVEAQKAADQLVKKCEEAYRITTTTGLAASFDQRAKELGWSLRLWVICLIGSLIAAAYLGSIRVNLLSAALSLNDPQWGVIWMNLALSIISIGAPIWIAWLSTKQIGQRFRLVEDYAFKASVAKAYEGYRKEAVSIDKEFEARLFSSALTRLEEAPLRLVEQATHGSPWHEFFTSQQFQNALATIPELKNKFLETVKDGVSFVQRNKVENATIKPANESPLQNPRSPHD